jgi:hypothetical protein
VCRLREPVAGERRRIRAAAGTLTEDHPLGGATAPGGPGGAPPYAALILYVQNPIGLYDGARKDCHSLDACKRERKSAAPLRRARMPGSGARRQDHVPGRHDVAAVRPMRPYVARLATRHAAAGHSQIARPRRPRAHCGQERELMLSAIPASRACCIESIHVQVLSDLPQFIIVAGPSSC